jgi:antitoxin YefM
MSTETISLSELQPHLSEYVERVHAFFERFRIVRDGKTEAVLLAAEDFDGLLETLDILSDKELVKRLVTADQEWAQGGGRSLEDVRAELRSAERKTVEPGRKSH